MDGFLTTKQVAAKYGVCRQRVTQWRTKMGLTAVRAGYVWLYPVPAVQTFVESLRGRPAAKREIIAS